jgi:hypothetical protein
MSNPACRTPTSMPPAPEKREIAFSLLLFAHFFLVDAMEASFDCSAGEKISFQKTTSEASSV